MFSIRKSVLIPVGCYHYAMALFALALVAATSARADTSILPKGTNLTSMVVITDGNLANAAQRVMIATLQGIVARQSGTQIYIDGGSGYSVWKNHLHSAYGIPLTTTSDPWSLVNQFKSLVSGYILYDVVANSNSVNAATSLCGPFNAIAVDASIEATARANGITNLILDVRTRNEAWVWTNYNGMLSRGTTLEQRESFTDNLRDYAAMAGAFTFFDGNSPFRNYVMSQMDPDAACLGYGDYSSGENVFVGNSSSNGVHMIPADWALDLSTLSGIRDTSFYQRTYANPVSETNVHYATFLVTDGDNVQWNLGDLPGYFNNAARGRFNMGWALSPALADIAPSVLRWYFDNSSNGPNRDFFVAGPSGSGYFYPSKYPAAELDLQVQRLDDYLCRADMNIAQIIDFNSFTNAKLWNKYLAQPDIDALIYLEYSRYDTPGGAMYFTTNGKPVLSARDQLWGGGLAGTENSNIVANINSYLRDPSSPAGYTLVLVLVWNKNLGDVLNVVTNLSPDVRVVTPDAYVKLIRDNVGRKLSYDFLTSTQGWVGATSGKPYDKAWWTGPTGSPANALLFDGSDLGTPDSIPNSWFSRQIILPPNATQLSFDTMANNDGMLRVRLQRPDGTFVTLIDWEGISAHNVWTNRTVSLASYAGQTVTIYLEQNDGGQGSGEYRYVDNVAILTSGPPLYIPAAPRLLPLADGTHVNLPWRDNDNNEAGFKVERCLGTNGAWAEIAGVQSNVTAYLDTSVISGTNYSYRVRSWNTQGFSPYSNVRTVTTLPIPSLAISVSGNWITLTWPSWATTYTLYTATTLGASAVWSPLSGATIQGTNFTKTFPMLTSSRFFQLRSP